ncbi:MAG TPA: alpha-hydroxy acid oxidase, partial [Candidatus Acidoferrales bacterium]|nr:alpha-hydroxy acid oxidase [Candidatus Acidoferrales bacterium]
AAATTTSAAQTEAQANVDRPGEPGAAKGAAPAGPVNLFEFEELAKRRLSRMAYDYIAQGAADEVTLRWNRASFDNLRLKPRALVDVSQLDTRMKLFGQAHEFPVLLAPTAYHKLVYREGERATARGAGAARATLVVSSFATVAIEDVAKAATSRLWFQLYVQPDRSFTRDLVQRAEAAGCQALVITVDTPIAGTRNREERDRFTLPPGMNVENLKDLLKQKATSAHRGDKDIYSAILDPRLTWEGIDWIRSFAKIPVLLKGIIAPEDAKLAVEHGAAGVIVSNHGARNLDTGPATIDALPRVIEAIEGRIPVLMDGGVRRGTDVVKALALGAKAVLIGRPYLWGLAVGGATGIERVLKILVTEFRAAMALCGVRSISEIDRRVLWEPGK